MNTGNNTITARFNTVVSDYGSHVAIIDSDFKEYTYDELNRLSDGIRAIFPNDKPKRVGILTGHGIEQIAAIFAVIRSGAAYVALEPAITGDKIRTIFKEADVDFVLTGQANAGRVKDFNPITIPAIETLMDGTADAPEVELSANTPAYILYTAGRTGKRKGVVVQHNNVTHYVRAFEHEFKLSTNDIVLQASVCTLDTFVEEIFVTLLSGATLAILPESNRGDIRSIVDFCERVGVTVASGFTIMIKALNNLKNFPSKLRLIIVNGEVLRPEDISAIKDKATIYYSYGLSETTVRASWQRCDNYTLADNESFYPIGKPIEGVEITILDENLEPCAIGEQGEISILGDGVTRGYINNDDDSSCFETMPDGRRVYLTGDIGSFDGEIFHFIEHKETVVTIDGRDITFSEIENVLRQDPNIENGAVCSFTDSKGKPYLVAYFTAKCAKAGISLSALRKHMKSKLAWFKIPEFFVQMHSLPKKRNGKINRQELPHIFKEK